MQGFTCVATVENVKAFEVWKAWKSLPDSAIAMTDAYERKVNILIANEFIDWSWYRLHDEYRPINSNVTR